MKNETYADYTLCQLEEHLVEAVNLDDLTATDIHQKIMTTLLDLRDYHLSKFNKLEKLIDLFTAMKLKPSTDCFSNASKEDWNDFWEGDIGTL